MQCLVLREVRDQHFSLPTGHTFECLCRKLYPGKVYDISGHFIWHHTQIDSTVKEIKLKKTDTPSSVNMNLHTVERISWKKANVWNMLSS